MFLSRLLASDARLESSIIMSFVVTRSSEQQSQPSNLAWHDPLWPDKLRIETVVHITFVINDIYIIG